jgi:hypothetical protein
MVCPVVEDGLNVAALILNWYGRADVSALSCGAVFILGSGYLHLTLLVFLIQTRVIFVAFITAYYRGGYEDI